MANSYVRFTGNGSTDTYTLGFPYRSKSDITVTINGSATTAFTWNGAGTQIIFTSPPADESSIEIKRTTSQGTRLTDYTAGAVLTENTLDTDSTQAFYMGQEAVDDAADTIQIDNSNFQFSAQSGGVNKRITNVANPTANQDAVTKHYLENTWLSTSDKTNLTAVAAKTTELGRLGTADAVADMNTLGTAAIVEDMNLLGTSDCVADMALLAVSDVISDMNTLADGTKLTNIATVAGSIANVNRYANEYTIASSAPGSPSEGDLWYDSTNNVLKYHNGSAFVAIEADTDVKVLVSSNDTTAGYLNGKLTAGANISLTEGSDGGNETLAIAATGLGTAAALDSGISNNNVPKFTTGVADDDFLRVSGTAIEGRSASEVLSDIGGQAALTFGIGDTNSLRANANVVDDDFLRVDGTSIEGRSASEVLSDIGGQGVLTSDGASMPLGASSEITLTHVADTGITLTNTVADTDNRPMVLNLKSEEDEIVADDVIGSIRFTGGDSGGTDAVLTGAKIDAIATDAHASDNNSTALTFSTGASEAATEKVRITPNGNLLANTTSASAASVVHELRTPTAYDDGKWAMKLVGTSGNTDGTGPYGLWVNYPNATPDNNSTNDAIFFSDATAARFMVISSGDFWSADGGWVDSDETLKENITDASGKLADVLNLKVRNFNWKESHHPSASDKKLIGFVAQEMETVFPGLVDTHDINPQGKDGTPNMKKGVKTTALIPILTKAIQELSAKVDALETRVATLEG